MLKLDTWPRRCGGPDWPALNVPLLTKVMDHIDAHPDEHDQDVWARRLDAASPCGTTYCFAGHAVNMTLAPGERFLFLNHDYPSPIAFSVRLGPAGIRDVPDLARERLGLSRGEALALFQSDPDLPADRMREMLRAMVRELVDAEQVRLSRLDR